MVSVECAKNRSQEVAPGTPRIYGENQMVASLCSLLQLNLAADWNLGAKRSEGCFRSLPNYAIGELYVVIALVVVDEQQWGGMLAVRVQLHGLL